MNYLERHQQMSEMISTSPKRVEIIAYCLMPNHYHLLLKQLTDHGISDFISLACNSYSKYYNNKHLRKGPLYEGPFKSNRVESNEQLVHLSRYVHLNPVASFLIKESELDEYSWSSLPEYLGAGDIMTDRDIVMSNFRSIENYRQFVHDRILDAQRLELIKHLAIDFEE